MYTCNLLQKSLGSRQYIRACAWSINVIAVAAQLDQQSSTSPSNPSMHPFLFSEQQTRRTTDFFFFRKCVFVYFSPSPFWNTQVKTLFPADRCELALVSGQGQVLFFLFLFSRGCSGYALEWIRSTWSKTTVGLGGIFLSRVWSHCLRKARYRCLW